MEHSIHNAIDSVMQCSIGIFDWNRCNIRWNIRVTFDGTFLLFTFDRTLDGTFDGIFDGAFDAIFDGTFDATFNGIFK